ncbi:matrix metallopeptidase 19-like precursor [Saccoglossus kowalevskii]|uniref:Matrix metallopeptidase 19-like precursor n=1 Tax=Saccoglossus kowalevskii TaxID=10224 RepID=A0ABM0GGV0_SACKO|nr:matrix metallopeptidase 19-like precursor [Saccoglossus kowalevskii]
MIAAHTLRILVMALAYTCHGYPAPTNVNPTEYLETYGYLNKDELHDAVDMQNAVMNFQRMANVEVSGNLDSATMSMMEMPRCGVEDMTGTAIMGTEMNETFSQFTSYRSKRYALAGRKWDRTNLTYKFVNFTPDLAIVEQKKTIEQAFAAWSDVTPLSFTEVFDGRPDILLEFSSGVHSDGKNAAFDGPGGVLAHAYYPQFGDAHFDDDEYFTVRTSDGVNLLFTAAHEFGHSLGLAHSSVSDALMYPFYQGYNPDFALTEDDIRGIQAIYGVPDATHPDEPGVDADGMTMETHSIPDICNTNIDTIFMDYDDVTFVTKGDYIWRINDAGVDEEYPRKINEEYPDLPGDIQAAFTSPWTLNTYFIKGRRIWKFKNRTLAGGYPKRTKDAGLPRDPDAAFVWSGEGKIYFFKGSRYYTWNEITGNVNRGNVQKIRKHWKGIPLNVDGAFQWKNRKTYFFKDDDYWRYDDLEMRASGGYPKSTKLWWVGCEGPVIAGRLSAKPAGSS